MEIPRKMLLSIIFVFLITHSVRAEIDKIPIAFISQNSNGTLFSLDELNTYKIEGIHAINIMQKDEVNSLIIDSQSIEQTKIDDKLNNQTLLAEEGYLKEGKVPVIIKLKPKPTETPMFGLLSFFNDDETKEEMFENAKEELVPKLEGTNEIKDLKIIDAVATEVPLEKMQEIENLEIVDKIYLDEKVELFIQNSVPLIGANNVWQLLDKNGKNITGKDISIAIIDTGVDYTHPDLGGCLGSSCKVVGGYDFVNSDSDPMDDHGHGTHVAATAAGNGTLKGVAPDAKIYGYKVLSSGGWGYWSWVISGVERATDPNNDGNYSDHVNILSMSLGGSGDEDDLVSQSVDRAVERGVISVVAAGNSGSSDNAIGSPGSARKAITVAASDKNNIIASFSSRGPSPKSNMKPDLTAPGVNICAAQWNSWLDSRHCYDNKHISISGTSMATPHVSGAVALLLQANSTWTPEMIKSSLMITSNDLGSSVWAQGSGRINLTRAINTPILTYPQSVSFGQISISNATAQITIQNLNNTSLAFNISSGLIYDSSNSYNVSYIINSSGANISSVTIPANQNSTINITINLGNVEGKLYGYINLTREGESFRIPYGVVRLSSLTINVIDSNGNLLRPYFIIAHDTNLGNFKVAYYTGAATLKVPGGSYIVNAVGDSRNRSLYYFLTGNTTVPVGGEANLTISTNDTKIVNVTGRNLQNNSLNLYKWQYAMRKVKGYKAISTSVGFFKFDFYGDRIVYLSRTDNDTFDTINFSFSYIGYPFRNNTFNVPSYTWNDKSYNTANELYFMSWYLGNITDNNTQVLNYTSNELGTLNYTYNWPGHDPSIGATNAGLSFSSLNFWISPTSFFDLAFWEQISVPLKRTIYVKGADSGFWHYIHPNYIHLPYWLDELDAASLQYEYDKEYKRIWPIGTRVAAGTSRSLHHGTTPYLPTYFRNTNTTINIADYFLSGFNNQTYIFKYKSSSYNIQFPNVTIYKDGSLATSAIERWDNCTKSTYLCSFLFPYSASAGNYFANITIPNTYPIQNITIISANFTLPSFDVNPPQLTFLNISPRFEINKNFSIEFNVTDDTQIKNTSAYISYDQSSWNSISVTNTSNSFNSTINITNSAATEISLKISITDNSNNQINYTFLPISMLARNITFTFSPSKNTANRNDTITFTGKIKDSSNNVGISQANLYYSVNNSRYDVDTTAYYGTIGTFSTKWTVPSGYSTTTANFSVTYNGTGVYLPLTNTSTININIPQPSGPSYSSLTLSPASPDANDNATINITWTNADQVFFESNFTTLQNYTPSQSGSIYSFAINSGNLSSGKVISYKYYANDSNNIWTSTPLQTFAVQEIPTNITASQTLLEIDVNQNNTLFCDYMEIGATDLLSSTVYAEIDSTNNTMNYNSTNGRYEFNYNATGQATGTKTWKCYANKTNYQTKSASSSFSIRAETNIPTFSNVLSSPATVYNTNNVTLNSTWQDNAALSYVILTSNFSGSWKNYTVAINPSNPYNASFTILSNNFSSNQIVGWKFIANDTNNNFNSLMPLQSFTLQNRAPLITITQNQTSGGWGEVWTFKINASDPDNDSFNVTLWSKPPSGNYSLNETQNGQTNVFIEFTFSSRYFVSSFIGNATVKFNVTDFKGGTNETSEINLVVEKDDVNSSIVAGNNETIERFGRTNITLRVRFFDTDRNEAINGTGKIYVTRDGTLPYDVIEDCTIVNGNCSVSIDPDTNYDVGSQFFIGGMADSDSYKSINSSQGNFSILGKLFIFVDSPFGAIDVLDMVYFNGTIYDDKSSGPNDPNPKPVKADQVTLEYRKSDRTAEWSSCSPVNETTGTKGVYYTCAINATETGLFPGFHGIRYSAQKINHTENNVTITHQFVIIKLIRFNTFANFTAFDMHKINGTRVNASLEIRPKANLTNIAINMTLNSSNPVNRNLSAVDIGKYLQIEVGETLKSNLSFAIVKINYTDDEISGYNISESSLRLYRFNGTDWVAYNNQSNDFLGGVNTEENYVWGNITQFSNFTVGGKKSDGQSCSSSSECSSENCATDYDGSGSWCSPSGYCSHDYNVSIYTNGYNLCSDSTTKQTCNSGAWTTQTCSNGCSDGACAAASTSSTGSTGTTSTPSGPAVPTIKNYTISQTVETTEEKITEKILEEDFRKVFEPLVGKLTEERAKELVEVSKNLKDKVSSPSRSLTINGVSTISLKLKNVGGEIFNNFVIYDIVPKTFANKSDEIRIDAPDALVSIVKKDPVYMFVYPTFRPGEEITINYTVNRNVSKTVINDTISPIILLAVPSKVPEKEEVVCIQVITPAINPLTNECSEFPTPCDVPEGWREVGECPPPLKEEEKQKIPIWSILALIAMVAIVLIIFKFKYKIIRKSRKRK